MALLVAETPSQPALFVPHHHLRARRTARLRTSRAQISGCHEGSQARRKLSPRTPHVPLASHRQSHRQALVTILVPDVLALRRLARTRVSAECRNQARPSRPGSHQSRDRAPSPERALAAEPPSSRTYSIADGDRCRQRKPLEHTARSPRPALVQQLNALVLSWACSRYGLGQNVAANLPFGTGDGQTFPDPVTEVLQTIQESVRSVNTTGLLRFADILVQPPAP